MKGIKPLYEKWLHDDKIPLSTIGNLLLGSSIACLQESGYSATSIIEQVTLCLFPNGVLEHARKVVDANRPLNPREVKIVTDYANRASKTGSDVAVSCVRCHKEFMPALFCSSCSGESPTDRPLNPQEVKIVTDYAYRDEKCPKCGNASVRAREMSEGGGIACTTKGCGYWFCY